MGSRKNVIQAALVATVLTEVSNLSNPIARTRRVGEMLLAIRLDSSATHQPPPSFGWFHDCDLLPSADSGAGRGVGGVRGAASRQEDGPAGGHALAGCGGGCGESARAGTRPGRQSGRRELLAPGADAERVWVCLCVEAPPPQSRSF